MAENNEDDILIKDAKQKKYQMKWSNEECCKD